MGYPQGYTRLEGYDSTKNYPFTLPFPTKITLLHIKKLPFYTTSCVYCLTFPILLYTTASQKQKLEKKPIHILWY